MTRTFARSAFVALLAATAIAQAQQAPDYSKVEIKATRQSDNFFTLEGQGGTISVLTGPDGVLMVDSQFAPLSERRRSARCRTSPSAI